MEFARQLQATVDPAIKDRDQRMYEAKEKALADGVVSRNAWEKAPLTASSDSGGAVSYTHLLQFSVLHHQERNQGKPAVHLSDHQNLQEEVVSG